MSDDRGATDGVIAALGGLDAAVPPPDLRSRILADASRRRRSTEHPVDPRDLFRARCTAMRDLLGSLEAHEWALPAHPYAWSVHGLLAHLLQIERYTAAVIGAAPPWPVEEPDHLDTGRVAIEAELHRDPQATLAAWTEVSAIVDASTRGDAWDPDVPAPLHGWPFTRSAALVARAFEVWTHADDVCRATGRPLATPPPAELRTMSSFSVAALPFLVGLTGSGQGIGALRIVLTGPGGGTFDLGGDTDDPSARSLLVADVVDYCNVVARRIPAADLASDRQGDTDLITRVLEASSAFAV